MTIDYVREDGSHAQLVIPDEFAHVELSGNYVRHHRYLDITPNAAYEINLRKPLVRY